MSAWLLTYSVELWSVEGILCILCELAGSSDYLS